jgi:4a-hydroxytetrahydrobiopterin dehydratase
MADTLTKKQIEDALVYLDGWVHKDNALVREFEFDSDEEKDAFLQQIRVVADEADHHPELAENDLVVTIRLTTHNAKGVTAKDTDLAESIQDLEP